MGPVFVVVPDVVDDESFELVLVPDDGAVEELSAQGADPAFGECVRDRSLYRLISGLPRVNQSNTMTLRRTTPMGIKPNLILVSAEAICVNQSTRLG